MIYCSLVFTVFSNICIFLDFPSFQAERNSFAISKLEKLYFQILLARQTESVNYDRLIINWTTITYSEIGGRKVDPT